MKYHLEQPGRREFLNLLGAGALGMTLARAAGAKAMRGIFVIASTPFTDSDKMDVDTLVEELKFVDRGGVHGFVWPQLGSEWSVLTERERLEGAEAIVAAGKRLRPTVLIGVQAPTTAAAVSYAKNAAKVGADGIISLPPADTSDPHTILEYYKAVGGATDLPLFVQAVGNMNAELLLEIYKAVPTMRYVKYEGKQQLVAIGTLRRESSDQIKVFTGDHGRILIDDMIRGSSGNMPAASFGDLYAQVWDLWQAGRHKEAFDIWGKTDALISEIGVYPGHETVKYMLCLRGVFKTYGVRRPPQRDSADAAKKGPAGGQSAGLDDTGKQLLREMFGYLKPYFRA